AGVPRCRWWGGLPRAPMDASALDALVPGPRGLLVAYLLTDDELLVVTVARGEDAPDVAVTAAPIDRRAFADALAAAMQPAVLQDVAEWRKRAAPLAAALLDPIASRLADRDRVVFVPDDLLWKVPFDALPAGDAGRLARGRHVGHVARAARASAPFGAASRSGASGAGRAGRADDPRRDPRAAPADAVHVEAAGRRGGARRGPGRCRRVRSRCRRACR